MDRWKLCYKKKNPNDMDLVTFVDFYIYQEKEKEFDALRRRRQDKNNFLDGYFVKTYPKEHIHYHWYELDKVQWIFTFNRAKNSKLDKGFLQLNF